MNSNQGWVKLHRSLLDHPVWACSSSEHKAVLIWILLNVNHSPKDWVWNGERFSVKEGQMITSQEHIAQGAGVSRQCVRTALKKFEKLGFLTSTSTNKSTLITVENWAFYQSYPQEVNQQINQQLTNKQPTANQQLTTNKNVRIKECKNERNLYSSDIINNPSKYNTTIESRLTEEEQETLFGMFDAVELFDLLQEINRNLNGDASGIRNPYRYILSICEKKRIKKTSQTTIF